MSISTVLHKNTPLIFRQPDIVVDGLIFYRDSFFLLLLFSSATLWARWMELN